MPQTRHTFGHRMRLSSSRHLRPQYTCPSFVGKNRLPQTLQFRLFRLARMSSPERTLQASEQ
ncbi:hypothetical protein APX01_09040 [Cereibacter sphaeroides]|nr:hypothetical protein APX01_09040 [Cereibacter sphaeroides]ANS34386.1 hypothetical protein A3858_09065 [Cereibacter sphaeroides]ATN63431.1 hypothetical protein A3857_09060 [Cereibacter sphaeroides]